MVASPVMISIGGIVDPASLQLTLIITCYQEAGYLRESVSRLMTLLRDTGLTWEIIFVDDCSTDGTLAIAGEICSLHAECRLLAHDVNRGRGAAFRTGFAAARGQVAGFIDADLEVSEKYIPALVREIIEGDADVAIGCRRYELRLNRRLLRSVLSIANRTVQRWLNVDACRDPEAGCKFFNRRTASKAVLECLEDGWVWDSEVMLRTALAGLKIAQAPVRFVYRGDKTSTVHLIRDVKHHFNGFRRMLPAVGLTCRGRSLFYSRGWIYELFMLMFRGSGYLSTLRQVAEFIPDGAEVLDVCCGPCRVYRYYLRNKKGHYSGCDVNGRFILEARRRGIAAFRIDLNTDPLPPTEVVTMISSFYHFKNRQDEMFSKLLDASKRLLIISEPVVNFSCSRWRAIGAAAKAFTNPGVGEYRLRYSLDEFRSFAEAHRAAVFSYQEGDLNAVAVFEKRRSLSSHDGTDS